MLSRIDYAALAVCCALVLVSPSRADDGSPAAAGEAEAKGLEIATEMDRRANRGFADYAVMADMILRNKNGKESHRALAVKVLSHETADRTLIHIQAPKDVKGTALLTWSEKSTDDKQWLYLPVLRRTKSIASANRSGPFMGSEFTYEDFIPQQIEDFNYRYLDQRACGEWQCHVVERQPKYENSGYNRQIVWVDIEEYRVFKVEYFDRRDAALKIMTAEKFELHDEKFWRARIVAMKNLQTGNETDIHWSDFRFDTGLSEQDFRRESLGRLR